eukprot:6178405-Pleurochrysis_carterae.AAC.2
MDARLRPCPIRMSAYFKRRHAHQRDFVSRVPLPRQSKPGILLHFTVWLGAAGRTRRYWRDNRKPVTPEKAPSKIGAVTRGIHYHVARPCLLKFYTSGGAAHQSPSTPLSRVLARRTCGAATEPSRAHYKAWHDWVSRFDMLQRSDAVQLSLFNI